MSNEEIKQTVLDTIIKLCERVISVCADEKSRINQEIETRKNRWWDNENE